MFLLYEIYFDHFEKKCIAYALQDLIKDLKLVSEKEIHIRNYLPGDPGGKMIVGNLKNERFAQFLDKNGIDVSQIEGKWENYVIRTLGDDDDTLLIAGSDERGTMWGIYTFSELFLNVDPLYLWTDMIPEKRHEIKISGTNITDGPKTFKYRGWFINDEDLLEGFSKACAKGDNFDFHASYGQVLDMIIETGLRLKQNLMIPCSFLDIEKPEEEDLVRRVTERGMFISMHHQEPVGVHQFTVDRYYKKCGIEDVNYFNHKEKYEFLWRKYIRKWSKYDNVIWQLGLRGRGDRPVWYNAGEIPATTKERGKLISDAIQKQFDIIREENPGKEIITTCTLWMEGMNLYKENALTFPEDTKVIFADFGPNQMWGEGYYTTPREKKRNYGLYYHVGFWGCGPHMAQGNPPEKIYFNYRKAVDKGDTDYSIVNIANLREFVYNIKCAADITWDIESFDIDQYPLSFCKQEFKAENASRLAAAYREYYKCFYEMDAGLIPGQMLFMDGMSKRVGVKLMEIIRGNELKQEDIQNKKLFDFPSTDEFIEYYQNATDVGIKRFKKLYNEATSAIDEVAKDRQQFYISNMIVQIEIILGLYYWVNQLCMAAKDRRTEANDAKYKLYIDEAIFALSKSESDRKKALTGKWEHWYDGDTLINLPKIIEMTKELKNL